MAATVRIGGTLATVENRRWRSESRELAEILNAWTDPVKRGPGDPNPDYRLAREAVQMFGGEVVSYDPSDRKPGRVY